MLIHFNVTPIDDPEALAPNPEALVNTIVALMDDDTVDPEAVKQLLDEGSILVPLMNSWAVVCALAACGYDVDPREGIQPALVPGTDTLGNRAIPDAYTLEGVSLRLWSKGEIGPVDALFIPAYLSAFNNAAPQDDEDRAKSGVLAARAVRALLEGAVHPEVIQAAGLMGCIQVSDVETQLGPEEDVNESA